MTDGFNKREVAKLTKGMRRIPDAASAHIFSAQQINAREASSAMQALVPKTGPHATGETAGSSVATAYKRSSDGAIGFAMTTQRDNKEGRSADKTERIRAILFANNTDFFYGVWNLNKKRWRARMNRAMRTSAKEVARGLK